MVLFFNIEESKFIYRYFICIKFLERWVLYVNNYLYCWNFYKYILILLLGEIIKII